MTITVLNKIPIVEWVLGTARRMQAAATENRSAWNDCWLATYRQLGGRARTTGSKPCPMAAAYGLWYLGLFEDTPRKRLGWSIHLIDERLGKNATYAVIAAELLEAGQSAELGSLWSKVRSKYTAATGNDAADKEQGEIRLVVGLFAGGQLRSMNS